MPGKTPVLVLPDGGVIECLVLMGIPQVDFNDPRCFPKRGRAVPTWIEIQLPVAGKRGRLSAQVTLGRRIPRAKKATSSAVLATDVCDEGDSERSGGEDDASNAEDVRTISDVIGGDSLASVQDKEELILKDGEGGPARKDGSSDSALDTYHTCLS